MHIHLYKLVTGETIIACFKTMVDYSTTTGNIMVRIVDYPMVIDYWATQDRLEPWVKGVKTNIDIPIPSASLIVVAEQDHIDDVLVEDYISFLVSQKYIDTDIQK